MLGVAPRRPVQRRERDATRSRSADDLDRGIERQHGLGPIARVGRDTILARPEHRVEAVHPVERRASRTWVALVASRPTHVAEIGAAGALKHVAAEGRHVAQLRTRGEEQGLRQHRIGLDDGRVPCGFGHRRESTEPQTIRCGRDGGSIAAKRSHIHDMGRRHGLELHEVEQGGAAGEELRREPALHGGAGRGCRKRSGRVGRSGGTFEGERQHG